MNKRKVVFGIISFILIFVVMISLIWWFNDLGFEFMPDPDNLVEQAEGLAYSITVLIVLLYLVSGFFLLMEGRVSDIEVQKKFHYSLSALFILVGLAQGAVSLYSIVKAGIGSAEAAALMPYDGLLNRGDVAMAFALASMASVFIINSIEKYILNSRKKVLTTLMVLASIGSIMTIAGMYISVTFGGIIPDWYEYYDYLTIILMFIGLVITMLALPIIYFRLANQTSGDLRRNSATIAWGYLLTFLMVVLHMLRDQLGDIPLGWVIFLVGNFIGAMILLAGYLKSTY